MPPFATANTIYYEPTTSTTTSTSTTSPTVYTTIGPTSISFVHEDTKEKMKEYCDKVDQHVDKLEEDIEFLNNQRISHDQVIESLIHANIEKDNKIKDLTDTIESLKGYVSYIADRLDLLEEKPNENNS